MPGAPLGDIDAPWVEDAIATTAGLVPKVGTTLRFADMLGTWKVRSGFGRMKYSVKPGLYAVGSPLHDSPVLVSANYKLSFDTLRSRLKGRDVWILVLDTQGVNVWCAAGKGTFGTAEIMKRARAVKLDEIVTRRTLIIPQLGAPGVSAHKVKQGIGFSVVYGPVRADDLPAYLDAGMKATKEMRAVTFPLKDRAVLIPVEIVGWGKLAILFTLLFFFLGGLGRDGYSTSRAEVIGTNSVIFFIAAYLAGAILTPAFLPWLPSRSFSAKGMWIGLALAVGLLLFNWPGPGVFDRWIHVAAWFLILPAVTSFIALNFTGCSTYTSLSGVRKEMRTAVPAQIASMAVGLVLWMAGLFV